MTKKDYIKIAQILNAAKDAAWMNTEAYAQLVTGFSIMLSEDNPRFDRNRFKQACELISDNSK